MLLKHGFDISTVAIFAIGWRRASVCRSPVDGVSLVSIIHIARINIVPQHLAKSALTSKSALIRNFPYSV